VIRVAARRARSDAVVGGILRRLRYGDSCVAPFATTRMTRSASGRPVRRRGSRGRREGRRRANMRPRSARAIAGAREARGGESDRREFAPLRQVERPAAARAVLPNQ
jgi:hypothetical protein